MRKYLVLSLAIFLAHAYSNGLAPAQAEGRKLALVIGVHDYNAPLTDLKYAASDAKAFKNVLIQYGGFSADDITLLFSGADDDKDAPYLDTINAKLEGMLAEAGIEDTVLVFFSGHGLPEGYLAPQDCRLSKLETTALPMKALNEKLRKCSAKRKILILDCCYASAVNDKGVGRKGPVNRAQLFSQAEGFYILSSCKADQTSREFSEKELGLFTHFLVEGLKGAADAPDRETGKPDGNIGIDELYDYVRDEVSRTAEEHLKGHQQHPTMFSKGSGQLVLSTYKVATGALAGFAREFPTLTIPVPLPSTELVIPKSNFELAEEAFEKLASANNRDKANVLQDADTLVREAARLRTPEASQQDTAGKTLNLSNPFFEPERSERVYKWMQVARKTYASLGEEVPVSLKVSLALAAWYKKNPDPVLARQIMNELRDATQLDKLEDAETVRAQLLLVNAHTRGSASALQTYLKLLDEINSNDRSFQRAPELSMIADGILKPALVTIDQMAANDIETYKKDAARAFGEYGEIIRRSGISSEYPLGIEYFEKAIDLDPSEPAYAIGRISLLLLCPEESKANLSEGSRDYSRDRAITDLTALIPSLRQGNDGTRGRLFGTLGLALHENSRSQATKRDQVAMLERAIEAYSAAIEAYASLKDSRSLRKTDQVEFAHAYQNRGNARVLIANFKDMSRSQQAEILRSAAKDGEAAQLLDRNRGHQCYLLVGNAYEDMGWLAGNEGESENAQAIFKLACEKFPHEAKCRVAMGRCLYKDKNSSDAKDYLVSSLTVSRSPEALYWLGLIASEEGDFAGSLKYLDEALALHGAQKLSDRSKDDLIECLRAGCKVRQKLLRNNLVRANAAPALLSERDKEVRMRLDDDVHALKVLSKFHGILTEVDNLQVDADVEYHQGSAFAVATKMRDAANAKGDKILTRSLAVLRSFLADSGRTELTDVQRLALLVRLMEICALNPRVLDEEFKDPKLVLLLESREAVALANKIFTNSNSSADHLTIAHRAYGWGGLLLAYYSVRQKDEAAIATRKQAEGRLRFALGLTDPPPEVPHVKQADDWRFAYSLALVLGMKQGHDPKEVQKLFIQAKDDCKNEADKTQIVRDLNNFLRRPVNRPPVQRAAK